MGSYVNASFGYGIRLPSGHDDVYEPSEWASMFLDDEDGQGSVDWYEVGEALARLFPGTTVDLQYTHDWSEGSVFYVSWVGSFDGISKVPFDALDREVDNDVLRQAAELLGIECEPGWFLVASYG